jgi:hypothetical protein
MLSSRALLCVGLLMGPFAQAQEQPARPLPAATRLASGSTQIIRARGRER